MKRLKLYLDTTVISHLYALDVPEKMEQTKELWKQIEADICDIVLSDVVFYEINNCYEYKRKIMLNYINNISYFHSIECDLVKKISEALINANILSRKHYLDCEHIGHSIINECDFLVSWNYRHLVNVKTGNGVRQITDTMGYKVTGIITPIMLIY